MIPYGDTLGEYMTYYTNQDYHYFLHKHLITHIRE